MSSKLLNILKKSKKSFIKIKEVVYEKDNPKKENFETILSSMDNINFQYIYLILGKKDRCEIYLGCIENKNFEISTNEYLCDILDPIFKGVFKGSKTELLTSGDIEENITNFLSKNKRESNLIGIPTCNHEDKNDDNQYIDTIINSMIGIEYCISVVFENYSKDQINNLELDLNKMYENLNETGKKNIQKSTGCGKNNTVSNSKNNSKNKNSSETQTKDETSGNSRKSIAKSNQESDIQSEDHSESTSLSENQNESIAIEKIDKLALNRLKLMDDFDFPRINLAKSKGMFKVKTYLSSTNVVYLERLENIIKSLYQGGENNSNPLKISSEKDDTSTLLTLKELSLLIGIPKSEIIGLEINQGVDFALNFPEIKSKNKIELGNLLNRGTKINKIVSLDKKELNKHIFIGGVTGSGKTTTSHNLLIKSELPFLVIEPAKTEYRELRKIITDLKIYTLGDEKTLPFRINPFEFLEIENITSHVDMLKASFEASFEMEAAIPQLLEAAIYRSYERYGWDIDDNTNIYLENRKDAWNTGGIYFPTLEDLLKNVEEIINEQGFDERLKKDYLGSIKARLQSLLIGSKGQMLNTRVSIDFENLLKEKVILELEEIKSGGDKSLIIALIITRLCETLKSIFLKDPNFKHITLIEEAHRLLAKIAPGESPNKKQAIELFTDMLAEVRKYGEALIIADQIPNKLASEVLKNTNTKIIHKIFARDDKEVVGDTMSMNDLQKSYLSNLKVGEAVIFSQNWKMPVHTKIFSMTNTSGKLMTNQELRKILRPTILQDNIISFYPESLFLNENSIENLEIYQKEYKKLYRYFKVDKTLFLDYFNTLPEKVKKYFVYKLIITKKANRIKENPEIALTKEFESFMKKINTLKIMTINDYINKIIL